VTSPTLAHVNQLPRNETDGLYGVPAGVTTAVHAPPSPFREPEASERTMARPADDCPRATHIASRSVIECTIGRRYKPDVALLRVPLLRESLSCHVLRGHRLCVFSAATP